LGGVGALVNSLVTDEGVNQSGFVPGVAFGFILLTIAGWSFVAAKQVEHGRYLQLAALVVLIGWSAGSTYLVVWGLPPGSLREVPMGIIIGLLIVAGFLLTELTVIYLLVLFPLLTAMAWIADRIPALRRRTVGEKIRDERRPRR
jgi:hypothetical protein